MIRLRSIDQLGIKMGMLKGSCYHFENAAYRSWVFEIPFWCFSRATVKCVTNNFVLQL